MKRNNADREPAEGSIGRMKGYGHLLASAALTVLIGYLIYRQVPDWRQSLVVMLQGNPVWLVAALCFVAFHMLLRAARWGVLLKNSKRNISFKNLLSLTLVKYVINVIPPRTGEVAASLVLAKKENISAGTVIAASVFERILDMVTVLVMMLVYLVFLGDRFTPESENGKQIVLAIGTYSIKTIIVAAIGLAVVACLLRAKRWAHWLPARIRTVAVHFLDGFHALRSRGAIVEVLLLSAAIWISIMIQTWCLVRAYLQPFPLAGALLLMGLTVVGVAIPTPAGVGGYQYFMSLGLVNFFGKYLSLADPHSQAAGISNGCYLTATLPVIIAGMVFLNTEGALLGRVAGMRRQAEEPVGSHAGTLRHQEAPSRQATGLMAVQQKEEKRG